MTGHFSFAYARTRHACPATAPAPHHQLHRHLPPRLLHLNRRLIHRKNDAPRLFIDTKPTTRRATHPMHPHTTHLEVVHFDPFRDDGSAIRAIQYANAYISGSVPAGAGLLACLTFCSVCNVRAERASVFLRTTNLLLNCFRSGRRESWVEPRSRRDQAPEHSSHTDRGEDRYYAGSLIDSWSVRLL